MIESLSSKNPRTSKNLNREILRFLESRGTIKAALLHKIESYFCSPKSKYNLSRDVLINFLLNMMKEKLIEVIIPELFKVKWKRRNLSKLRFLKDGSYYCRTFTKFKSKYLHEYRQNEYYFDSRKINHDDQALVSNWIEHLSLISRKIKDLNKKLIVFCPRNSNPIDIYEKEFEGHNCVDSFELNTEEKELHENKMEIPLEQQAEDILIIKVYRSKYACFYIPLIEAIQKVIEDLQKNKGEIENFKEKLSNYVKKFAYQCVEFVKSDYVEINEPNPYRWETFFKFFDINVRVLNFRYRSIRFHGRTFDTYNQIKYCIFIDKDFKDVIEKLKKIGYKVFPDLNYDDKIAIGLDFEFYFPCSTIEHLYFVAKYVCYYHLFLLFYHTFEYIKKIKPGIKFSEKEKNLYKTFSPIMQLLFGQQDDVKIHNNLVFKYYTYDANELELIFNKFLLENVKLIEKKMFRYFFIKYGQQKIDLKHEKFPQNSLF